MAQQLEVRLVAADHEVWRGEAYMVLARTLDGDLGVLPGHAPLLGVLGNGPVRIRQRSGDRVEAAVHGGFLSVANDQVTILAEAAELGHEIDVDRARRALDAVAGRDDEESRAAAARAQTRLNVAGATS